MWEDVTEPVAAKIGLSETVLVLGASDTGKTTFAIELAILLAKNQPVAFIDADIGQSRIGPPTAVGWSLVNDSKKDFSQFDTKGLFFVGAVSPVGHLLQFTAALVKCVRQAAEAARILVIDTPGYVANPAATSLWWAVSDILMPTKILLLQRHDELAEFVLGIEGLHCEMIDVKTPGQVPLKSMVERQLNRRKKYQEYFANSAIYEISLNNVAIQAREIVLDYMYVNRMIALRDSGGKDLAIGRVIKWDSTKAIVQAPEIDINMITCLVIGDAFYESNDT
jgi:polynucleotide 5'-kinase involved in rRNA processing